MSKSRTWIIIIVIAAVVAALVAAAGAWIDIGDAVADRAVGDGVLHVANGRAQALGVLAGRAQDVEGETLRALAADARQALQLVDQACERFGLGHASQDNPGIFSPPIMPPSCCDIASSTFR